MSDMERDERNGTEGEGASVSGRGPEGEGKPASAGTPGDRGMSRRRMLKVIAVSAAAPAVLGGCGTGEEGAAGGGAAGANGAAGTPDARPGATWVGNPKAAGTRWDPDLVKPVIPWDGKLDDDELESLAALCDMIIPADDVSPSASAVGCHLYVDEWVSAPYDFAENDLVLVRGGLRWLDTESARRYGYNQRFRELTVDQKAAICDDICYLPEAAPEFRRAARFFDKVRDLTATAFYTTDEGMEDLGYVGNVPLPEWRPPPDAVLRQVGLEP